MGAIVGLALGAGIVLVWWVVADPTWVPPRPRATGPDVRGLLVRAGLPEARPGQLVAACAAAFTVTFVVMAGISRVAVVALVFAFAAGAAPVVLLRGRARRRLRALGELWPDAVDNLASAVRAGLSLPEALHQLGERGPDGLRGPFAAFSRDYQSSGRFGDSLDMLKHRLADPVGDRVVEALRIARDVGGGDLGRMLRSLSGFLRDDLRTRGELESRQSWTVNGARLAVAAPWIVLLLMSFQHGVVARFASGAGVVVLGGGAATCIVAYRLMIWLGRLPTERRVLA